MTGEFVVGGRSYVSSEVLYNGGLDLLFPNFDAEARVKIRRDSEVESSVEFLIDSVFAEGVTPVSVIADEEHPEFEKAKEIAEFVVKATCNLTRSVEAVMREIFRGAFYEGVKVGEIVVKITGSGETYLDRINPKENSATGFKVDKFKNVLGLVAIPDTGELIRRDKFVVLSFELIDNDPRGYAKILAAVEAWCDKQKTRPQYDEWSRTSAIPKKFGTTPVKDVELTDDKGQKLKNSDGSPQKMNGQKALLKALEGWGNNANVTGPDGTKVQQFEVSGNGIQFINRFKFSNSEIRKAILGDSVTTGQDDKGVKAAKSVAMNVVELRVMSYKRPVADCVKRDIYRLLTVMNFGKRYAHLTPDCSLGDTERRDWNDTADSLNKIGYKMADEHMPEGDRMLGFKPVARKAEEKSDNSNGDGKNDDGQGDSKE